MAFSSLLLRSTRSYSLVSSIRSTTSNTLRLPSSYSASSKSLLINKLYSTKSSSSETTPTTPPPNANATDPASPTITSTSEIPQETALDESIPLSSTTPTPTPPPTESIVPTQSLAEQYLGLSEVVPPPSSKERFPGNTTGARSRSPKSKSTNDKRRAAMTKGFVVAGVLATALGAGFLAREWDSEEEMMKLIARTDDFDSVKEAELPSYQGMLGRAKLRAADYADYLNKPAWDPLIPPPLPEPHGRPYTLIVDLDDLLVHSVWDREYGWRTAKRPGVDYFLAYLSQFYEIVLFTTQPSYTAAPIVEKLDPYGAYIPWKLYRESTRYKNKSLCKDLSYLGRPLSKTIILDTSSEHVQLQPSNAIVLTPWTGSKSDAVSRELVSLIPFLEALAIQQVADVRTVIEYYQKEGKGNMIPSAYAEAERREKEKVREEWEKGREGRERKQGWKNALFGAIGGSTKKSVDEPPELYIELARKHAQRLYLEEQKFWKDNEALIKQQMDDDRAKQLKDMKGSLLDYIGGFTPPVPPPNNAVA